MIIKAERKLARGTTSSHKNAKRAWSQRGLTHKTINSIRTYYIREQWKDVISVSIYYARYNSNHGRQMRMRPMFTWFRYEEVLKKKFDARYMKRQKEWIKEKN
jgi:hypothetical protein